jgi:hypothetical protein
VFLAALGLFIAPSSAAMIDGPGATEAPAQSPLECSTGQVTFARVSAILRRETRTLVTLYTAAGPIVTTPEHPFARVGSGWTAAGDLASGDRIVTADEAEPAIVLRSETRQVEPTSVYNLTVEPGHAYYVGVDRLLAHNMQKGQCSNAYPTEKAKDRRERLKAEKEAEARKKQEERERRKAETEAVVQANAARLRASQLEAIAALQSLKHAAKDVDPDAMIGFRGSLANGRKGPQKGNAPWNPDEFDVDAFIVSDVLASRWDASDGKGVYVSMKGDKMKDGRKIGSGWRDLTDQLDPRDPRDKELIYGLAEAEASIRNMRGVRPDEKFKIRVFSRAEYQKMLERSRDPLFPDQPVLARQVPAPRALVPAAVLPRPASFIVTV